MRRPRTALESMGSAANTVGRMVGETALSLGLNIPGRAISGLADYVAGDRASGYRSSAAQQRSARRAQDTRSGLRSEATSAMRQRAGNLGGDVRRLEQLAEDNQQAIKQGAAQAVAAGMDPGMAQGGAMIGAAGQVGMDASMRAQQAAYDDFAKIAQAKDKAAMARVEAAEYEAQQGNEEEEYQAALAQGVTEAEQAIKDGQGFWNDDEAAMMRQIRSTVARLRATNPRAAAELEQKYLNPDGEGYKRIHSWWD